MALTPGEKLIVDIMRIPRFEPLTLSGFEARMKAIAQLDGRPGTPRRKKVRSILKSLVSKGYMSEEGGFYELTDAGREVAAALAADSDMTIGAYTRRDS